MKPRVNSVGVHTHTVEAQGTSHDGWWLLVHSGLSFLFSGFPKLKTEADLFTMVKAGLASWKMMAAASVCFMYPLAYTYLCFKFLMSFCFLVGKSLDLILYLGPCVPLL